MKSVRLLLMAMAFYLPFNLHAMDHTKPEMLPDEHYKEYWEQHVLFEDGTFVTSQFLVANFPWPVGDDHAIMVSTVVTPDGRRTIIKNGRNPGEWGFDKEKFNLFIHTHRIKEENGLHEVHLGADDKNEVNMRGRTEISPLKHKRFEEDDAFMEAAIYQPYLEGEGNWAILQEDGVSFVKGAGKLQGFATHVKLNAPLEDLIDSWLRVSGLEGETAQPVPLLSAVERPDGGKDIVLTLKGVDGSITEFKDVRLKYKKMIKAEKKSSYPSVIEVTAHGGGRKMTGTIRLTRKIDHFNITDHLNFFERGFAQSRASVSNYRYIADYDLTLASATDKQVIRGKALSEYADVIAPKEKKIRRSPRRR